MKTPAAEYSVHIYEMMARLGIDPGAGVLPRLSLRYAGSFFLRAAVLEASSCKRVDLA
jgi:hypothetical protein